MKLKYAALFHVLVVSILLAGCSLSKRDARPERLYLEPVARDSEGYDRNGEAAVFENEDIKVTLRPLGECCGRKDDGFLKELFDSNYVILSMEIENRSSKRVIYNPSHTMLLVGALDLKKPLNYTDLYDIVSRNKEYALPERRLSSLRGRFYDLNTRVPPGDRTSRLLIFHPLAKESRPGTKAVLRINEFYVGTDTMRLVFPLRVKAMPREWESTLRGQGGPSG